MSDSEEKPEPATAIPSWQRGDSPDESPEDEAVDQAKPQESPEALQDQDRLDVARRFLQDDNVKHAPREKKVEFLKAKGLGDQDVDRLLGEEEDSVPEKQSQPEHNTEYTPVPDPELGEDNATPAQRQQPPPTPTSTQATPSTSPTSLSKDRPPIVTYPEFLAKPARPPPLVTKDRLLNTLYAFTGLSTLLYGTNKAVVEPMLQAQTEARHDFHDTTSQRLDALVKKLEGCVSKVPPRNKEPGAPDESSSEAEDPAEMFHRDMGTQTSFSSSRAVSPRLGSREPATKYQSVALDRLSKSLTGLRNDIRMEGDSLDNVRVSLYVCRDECEGYAYNNRSPLPGTFGVLGSGMRNDPNDEIRKARDNVRKLKGVLLSSRNFPATRGVYATTPSQ